MFDYIDMPKGLTQCDWGKEPISTFSTNYNNLYNFYPHITESKASVGHGVIVAPSGGGKTTFVQYLMKGIIEKYKNVDVYSFDRFNGMSIFTNWIGGRDINFTNIAINPLQIDISTAENLEFLHNFLTMLAIPENPVEKTSLYEFGNLLSTLDFKDRILKNLVHLISEESLKNKLEIWCTGKYAKFINAGEDRFNLDDNFLNFQMNEILDDEELSAPIIYYIMFKTRQKARNTSRGHFAFIDEAARMVKNPCFQAKIEELLLEHRKLGGCVWLAFQNPNSFLKDKNLKELILNQCQNQILFTSDAIKQETLDAFNIHFSIYNEVLTAQKTNDNPYYILLKRPNENVILNINLKEKMGENLKFLSSGKDDINKMKELQEKYGEKWHEHY